MATIGDLYKRADDELKQRLRNNPDIILIADALPWCNIVLTIADGDLVFIKVERTIKCDEKPKTK